MPRREQRPPTTAHKITTYQELREFARAFANGDIPLLVVMSTPGVGKSQTIKAATEGIRTLTIKGRKSAIDFHTDSYHYQDDPVVLDDADSMLGDRLCRSYIKMLTETDQYKRIDYGTKTKILEREGVPKSFFTTSPVCILTNHWDSGDVILNAIESRAEFVHFVPAWDEVYRYIGGWFWDQEIFDYLYNRLGCRPFPGKK